MNFIKRILPFLFLLILFPALNAQNDQATLHMKRGQEAFLNGQFAEAVDHFNRVIQLKPSHKVYAYRGNALLIMKQYQQAEKDFSRAIDYYLRTQQHRAPEGGFAFGDMVIIQPGQGEEVPLAMIYNNRGIARYYQGMAADAVEDFSSALDIDPGLNIAQRNKMAASSGRTPQGINSNRGPNASGTPTGRTPYVNNYNRYSRPVNTPAPQDRERQFNQTEDLRELRTLEITDEGNSRGGIFGPRVPKPFERRSIPKKGKFYKEPQVKAQSQNYITIDNVKITDRATFIRLRVENREEKPYFISLQKPRTPGAFYLTDRSGSQRATYKLRRVVEGVATHPKTTELKPGEPIYITLEFEKIPDTLGFVNLIEGDRQDGQAWNFYQIDLTR
ncbi:MAG: hypothetical protein AAFN10_27115 [Bacteroidota bacterium]